MCGNLSKGMLSLRTIEGCVRDDSKKGKVKKDKKRLKHTESQFPDTC